ncbi:glycosyltransferase family 4 protein [Georgenia sp. SUBG003]|uniref:glycosyltransferase family 4 protein n=1 Tax=Georgenia sp. SUBG003 TaxID=1497974 RepID=UPI0004D581BF|nr:hypothetical protein DA06_04325 [Georgenia sp. SUBG003]
MKTHVGMVSQWYDPERGSAALPGIISRSLHQRGHKVDVVTGVPNYPTGSVYSGYSVRPYRRENIQNVTVHRAPLYPSHDSNPIKRATNYLSFAVAASAVATAALRDVDSVLVHSTPATAALPALALKALRRKPFVVHIQDLWPQTVVSSGFLDESRAGWVERTLHRYCDTVYRHAHTVAVTSPGMAELVARRGVDEKKIAFVPNWADERAFRPVERDVELARRLGISRSLTVMYAGNFGEFQALDTLIDAATILRDRSDIGFALIGGGVEEARLRKVVEDRGLENVVFVGQQPFDRMAAVLALGDIQLVSLQDLPLFRTTLPSKLQATLAAGRPVLGAVTGDAAEVIRGSAAGVVVTPGSAVEMAEAIVNLSNLAPIERQSLGAAGRAHYLERYSEEVAADRLSDLLERAARSTA